MSPTDIFEALEKISSQAFDPIEFPFAFARAIDVAEAAISKLRTGASNKSDLPNGVLVNRKFHYAPALDSGVDVTLAALRNSAKTNLAKPFVLIATDGEMVAVQQRISGETLHCRFNEIGDNFGFFLPAAGLERYAAVQENPVDVQATGKLARLYDALIRANPDWGDECKRHEMNQLMMRLIFCMFSEDVGIFPCNEFSRNLVNHSGNKGEETREVIIAAFTAMNRPRKQRNDLPEWAKELQYVNGGLFAGTIDAPKFDLISYRYLREACNLDWREINPDIFGSMIQSVANPIKRSELGMHYTSVPNIMKVIGPLFLDDLDDRIERAWGNASSLRGVLARLGRIRIFDPACGSGNFLVVSYRQLRERETRILTRMEELTGESTREMFSVIQIAHFYGVELVDFAAETAKLALFIAEYQANAVFREVFGQAPASLPLRESAQIVCANALRIDWERVCPPPSGDEEVYIVGNPPFLGKAKQTKEQKADRDYVFDGNLTTYKSLDFVAGWTFKAGNYIRGKNSAAALVSTNSLCQGASVPMLWPAVLSDDLEISFAHRSFKWRNSAARNAAVVCSIVGMRNKSKSPKRLFEGDYAEVVRHINGYLVNYPDVWVRGVTGKSLYDLPHMAFGNMPYDGGKLLFNPQQKTEFLLAEPGAEKFIRRFMGAQEVTKGIERYCLWIDDEELHEAMLLPRVKEKIEETRKARLEMKDAAGRALAERPHQFREHNSASKHSILVPSATTERRHYLPVVLVGPDVISSNLNMVLYDAPEWCVALLASRIHLIWIATVCGKLKTDFRYSNTLGWNTFPVPNFEDHQLQLLKTSARNILKARYSNYPATITELYEPGQMPDDLRNAHRENDKLLETMYVGREFRNDTERLEHLFKLYAAKTRQSVKGAAKHLKV